MLLSVTRLLIGHAKIILRKRAVSGTPWCNSCNNQVNNERTNSSTVLPMNPPDFAADGFPAFRDISM